MIETNISLKEGEKGGERGRGEGEWTGGEGKRGGGWGMRGITLILHCICATPKGRRRRADTYFYQPPSPFNTEFLLLKPTLQSEYTEFAKL